MKNTTRRTFLGTAGIAGIAAIAGCAASGSDNDDTGSDEYPAIDRWLTETDVGAAEDSYDGTLRDMTDEDTVTVDVGAEGNQGNLAFDPPANVVSEGTTIEWSWTGNGNPHNVEAEPNDQIGESDYEFSSGESEGGSGVKFTKTMDEVGIALYHCEPHLALGMKGGIAVV